MAQNKRRKSPVAKGTSSDPYTRRTKPLPKQIESSSSLWLDFFQQFCDLVIERDDQWSMREDQEFIDRARILADHALEAFQTRFPGVHL